MNKQSTEGEPTKAAARVEQEPDLTCIPLSFEEPTGDLTHLQQDVIRRLPLDVPL